MGLDIRHDEACVSHDIEKSLDAHARVSRFIREDDRMGITTLLNVMRDAGLIVTDIETHQSSLEDIFVDLMRQAP